MSLKNNPMTFPEGIQAKRCGSDVIGVKFPSRNVPGVMKDKPSSREIVKQPPRPSLRDNGTILHRKLILGYNDTLIHFLCRRRTYHLDTWDSTGIVPK